MHDVGLVCVSVSYVIPHWAVEMKLVHRDRSAFEISHNYHISSHSLMLEGRRGGEYRGGINDEPA